MITKLSDTQRIVLSRACARGDRTILPLPETLKGGAVQKVVGSLAAKELIAEAPAGPHQARWREDEHGAVTLVATDRAFAALDIELPPSLPVPSAPSAPAGTAEQAQGPATLPASSAPARRSRENTKQAKLIAMLGAGATVEEIAAATGWQKHTVRGALAGTLKKRLGLPVTSRKVEGRGRVYSLGNG